MCCLLPSDRGLPGHLQYPGSRHDVESGSRNGIQRSTEQHGGEQRSLDQLQDLSG